MIFIGKFIDLTGQRFGKLTVIEKTRKESGKVAWLCLCDCGNTHITISYNLTHGICESCGCVSGFTIYNQQRKEKCKNTYDLSGEYGIGYTSKGEEFYFDLEDYDKIKDYIWCISDNGYVITKNPVCYNRIIFMHRLIMNVKEHKIKVDHIYHNKCDNRKSQLRLVNDNQNQYNMTKPKDNTSGYKGVYWHKNKEKWEALIQCDGKLKYLGLYDDINDAIEAREKAEIKYFGEYRNREN